MTMQTAMRSLLNAESTTAKDIYNVILKTNSAELACILHEHKTLSTARRGEIVAALWAARQRKILTALLNDAPAMREPAVLTNAARLLDLPRKVRALERKVEMLEGRNAKPKTLRQARATLAEAVDAASCVHSSFSASRSFNLLLRKALAKIPDERLEFDLLMFEKGPWKQLCDLAHPKPAIWKLPHFQEMAFGAAAPEGSLLAEAKEMSVASLPGMLERHPRLAECYSFIRTKLPVHTFDVAAKVALAKAMPLADAIWHYEELHTPASATCIDERLSAGEAIAGKLVAANSFGKLLERLLTFKRLKGATFWEKLMPHAEAKLEELRAQSSLALSGSKVRPLQQLAARALVNTGDAAAIASVPEAVAESVSASGLRVAVLGDASSSMQVAINAACICGAMLAACFDAELVFFNSKSFKAKHGTPRTALEVLQVCEEVRAGGTTSMAAALDHFYSQGMQIDLFVLVSDEGENTKCRGMFFDEMFAKYVREVNPSARCAFISFLHANDEGTILNRMKTMVNYSVAEDVEAAVKKAGVTEAATAVAIREAVELRSPMAGKVPTQHRFDPQRPDLSKFDGLLETILRDAREANPLLTIAAAGKSENDSEEWEGGPMPGQGPPPNQMPAQDMTASSLAAAPPEQQKQLLGERLFPLISAVEPQLAGKITGMLLEMDNGELLNLLESPEALNAKIMEAISVLQMHADGAAKPDGE